MKTKINIIVFLCLLCLNVSAKPYFPKGSKWESIQYDIAIGSGRVVINLKEISTVEDSIINGIVYQHFILTDNRDNPSDIYIREHNNCLYGWSTIGNAQKEHLLIDFNMNEGDSIILPHNYKNDSIVYHVTKVDSIQLQDGRFAKRLHFDKGKIPIIEYIGSEISLLPLFLDADDSDLYLETYLTSCYTVYDKIIYSQIINEQAYQDESCYSKIKDYYCGREFEHTRAPYIYLIDKNGNTDTLSIHYNTDLCEIPQPQFSFTEEEVISSSHFAFLGAEIGNNQQDTLFTKQLETIPLQDNDISKYRINLYIKSDHLPVTLSWDTLFFYKSDIDGSFITTYTDWFKQSDSQEAFVAKFIDTTNIVISQTSQTSDFAQVSMAIGNGEYANRWFRSHNDTLSYDNRKIFEMNKEWTIVCKDTTVKRYRVEDIKHICQQDYFELKEYKVDTTLQNEEYVQSYYVRNAEDLDCAFEYDMETNQESLLYDLGMKIGTRLDFNGLIFWVVNSKIEYIDTTNMIFLSTDAPTYHIYWKRNIGSLGDLMHPDIPTTDSLLCVKIGDEVIYSRGPIKGLSCNGVEDDILQTTADKAKIELVGNTLKIKDNSGIINVMLYNLQGQQIISTSETSIDISHFATGIYLVVVQTESGLYSKKIVVK